MSQSIAKETKTTTVCKNRAVEVNIESIKQACLELRGISSVTPLQELPRLSSLYSAKIYLKREDLQPVRSYKLRGAYVHIFRLDAKRRQRGVVCASAGNHAQGVAYAARLLGIPSTIFIPVNTPMQKVRRISELGNGNLQLHQVGDNFDDCAKEAATFAQEKDLELVPPFDSPAVIAGQGSIGVEIEEQLGMSPQIVVVPVGGGGLAAGISLALPKSELIGVEPMGASSFKEAINNGRVVKLPKIDNFVDGAAVAQVGELPFKILKDRFLNLVSIENGNLCTVMLELYQGEGIIAEPAGALALTGLKLVKEQIKGKVVVVILSGGNNDVSRYPEIIERSLIVRGLKYYFLLNFSQRPGTLRGFLDNVLGPTDDITFFEYMKKNNREEGPALVGIELANKDDLEGLLSRFKEFKVSFEMIEQESPLFRFLF